MKIKQDNYRIRKFRILLHKGLPRWINSALLIVILCLTYISHELQADIVKLEDGTILNGKIIKETGGDITFSNSYGTFSIEKKKIKKKVITSSYEEDLKLFQNEGIKVSRNTVKKNYNAGIKIKNKKKSLESKKDTGSYPYRKISMYLFYSRALGELGSIISNGIGLHLNCDFGLPVILNYTSRWYLPDIKIETSFYYFFKSPSSSMFFSAGAGPQWSFPFRNMEWGSFHFFAITGMTAISAKGDDYSGNGLTFSIRPAIGYSYPVQQLEILFQISYLYVYDSGLPLQSVGISAGAAYIF